MGTEHKLFDYNVGALVVLVISIGLAAILYGGGIISFNLLGPLGVCTFIFGPIGVYTIIYSFIARKELTYYLVWGTIMFAVAVTSALYNIINIFIVAGILIIVLAVIGLIAYMRNRK
jgi:hypothetical protein